MSILKLKPSCKDYIWGGTKLKEKFNKVYDEEILAETWELSCHDDGPSYIVSGEYNSLTLKEYLGKMGKVALGTNCEKFENFPVLIKFIDAKDNLSIQVHPEDEYALKNEGQYGKTEVWYVLDSEEGAYLYFGFKKDISKEEYRERIENDTLLEVLNKVEVKKGDVFFIESGTIHAIGAGITIAEIQQNSNLTYRVYDYGRIGKDGKKRDLHIEKAIEVTNREKNCLKENNSGHLADCKYFTVDKISLDDEGKEVIVDETSFKHLLFVDGGGQIQLDNEVINANIGDSFFITANSGKVKLIGNSNVLVTYLS